MLCDALGVHVSGYYAWLKEPLSPRAIEDQKLLGRIKQFWLESGGVYGYRKVYSDLQELGGGCRENRGYRFMRIAGLRARVGDHDIEVTHPMLLFQQVAKSVQCSHTE